MPSRELPSLEADEIDDLLYFTRANESDDLQQTLQELGQKYNCSPKTVIHHAVDPNSGNTLLHYCSANGLADLLKTLLLQLENDAASDEPTNAESSITSFVNRTNKESNTALHWASLNGQLEAVKLLVEFGADFSVRNSAGHLAVFEAERAGKGHVVEYLLEKSGPTLDPEDLADIQLEENGSSNGVQDPSNDRDNDASSADSNE